MNKRNKEEKKRNLAAPRYDEGENLPSTRGKAQPESGTAGGVQNAHHPELCCVGDGQGKEEEETEGVQVQHPGGPQIQKEQATKMLALSREEQPRPLSCRVQSVGQGRPNQEGPVTGRD